MILIIFTYLLFPSCSQVILAKRNIELNHHISNFEELCDCKVDIPVTIEKITPLEEGTRTLGVCYGFRMPTWIRSIKIDVDFWKEASYYEKEATVFHELGHCVLDLNHTNEMQGEYIFVRPKSLMYPYSFGLYKDFREEYINELFSRKPKYD